MGTFFGGLAIMSVRNPLDLALSPVDWVLHYVEIRSLFFGSIFLAVLLILAYLTNPSEASFRAFLTELSFRRHLSKLNDTHETEGDEVPLQYTLPQHDTKDNKQHHHKKSLDHRATEHSLSLRYHFANRAAVSLRTPAHIFRSFGVLTVAAVTPVLESSSCPSAKSVGKGAINSAEAKVSGSWFIGAFGKWWVAGTVELYKRDALLLSKESPDTKVGFLSFRPLDLIDVGLEGLKTPANQMPRAIPATKQKPSANANRSNGITKADVLPRSITPPPLPMSASLPLHVPRTPSKSATLVGSPPAHHPSDVTPLHPISPLQNRSSSNLFEQSPLIAEIMQQVAASQAATTDLRTQLSSFQSTSAHSHATLQSSLDVQKERRRQEDISRSELKTKTKALEDAKRHADSAKREAEKKLKVAQVARDKASNRMDRLRKDIETLQNKVSDDEKRVQRSQADTAASESEVTREIEAKRQEVKTVEDRIASLGQKARELEEKIATERQRLEKAKEEAVSRRKEYQERILRSRLSNPSLHSRFFSVDETSDWPANHPPYSPFDQPLPGISHYRHRDSDAGNFPPIVSSVNRQRSSSLTTMAPLKPLGTPIKAYPPLNRSSTGGLFLPFADLDAGQQPQVNGQAGALIPNGLFRTMEANTVKEINSYPQPILDTPPTPKFGSEDEEWSGDSKLLPRPIGRPSYSPVSPTKASDSSGSLPLSPSSLDQQNGNTAVYSHDHIDAQRASLSVRQPIVEEEPQDSSKSSTKPAQSRRWFTSPASKAAPPSLKERTGLNPDAKVFSFTKPKFLPTLALSQDNNLPRLIQPPSPPSSVSSRQGLTNCPKPDGAFLGMGSFFSSFSPFAPSPAEREVLARVLGTGNRSLDRLSNVSESPNTSSTALHLTSRLPTSPLIRPSARPQDDVTSAAIQWAAESSLASGSISSPAAKRSFFSSRHTRSATTGAESGLYNIPSSKETNNE